MISSECQWEIAAIREGRLNPRALSMRMKNVSRRGKLNRADSTTTIGISKISEKIHGRTSEASRCPYRLRSCQIAAGRTDMGRRTAAAARMLDPWKFLNCDPATE